MMHNIGIGCDFHALLCDAGHGYNLPLIHIHHI